MLTKHVGDWSNTFSQRNLLYFTLNLHSNMHGSCNVEALDLQFTDRDFILYMAEIVYNNFTEG
jgi:hypothetical protein